MNEGAVQTPQGILSYGPNLLGEQVYCFIRYNSDGVIQTPVFIRKAFPSEVKEFVKGVTV